MSAFAAIAYEDRVELISDGAVVDKGGNLAASYRKVYANNRVPLAFTARGNTGAIIGLWSFISMWTLSGSFDETVVSFQKFLTEGLGVLGKFPMDGVIVGISETGGPRILYFTTSSEVEGYEPFVLTDAGPYASGGPTPDESALELYGLRERVNQETLAEFGADLMEAVRLTRMNYNGEKLFGVGAHVDLATIRAEGVTIERLRTWPDKVGKKINP